MKYVRGLHRLNVKQLPALAPGWHHDGGGLYVLVGLRSASWVYRFAGRNMGLGSLSIVSLSEARIEQHVARKGLAFIQQNIEPACYLYRHYHPSGDLLYAGITLAPLRRQEEHTKEAAWRDMICRIVIEPFATREEAFVAEKIAIRTEFPKFNSMHNGQRHPFQELARRVS